ncbi:MAG TPA: hypothetical protein VIU40_00665, partial [Geobacteraceae bacterium]
PSLTNSVTAKCGNSNLPVAVMVKKHAGATYVFAVPVREGETTVRFTLKATTGDVPVEVLGENRTLPCAAGAFEDTFKAWDVHLYRLAPR